MAWTKDDGEEGRGFGGRAERGGRMQGAINSEIALALGSYSTPIESRYRGEDRAVTIADSQPVLHL